MHDAPPPPRRKLIDIGITFHIKYTKVLHATTDILTEPDYLLGRHWPFVH